LRDHSAIQIFADLPAQNSTPSWEMAMPRAPIVLLFLLSLTACASAPEAPRPVGRLSLEEMRGALGGFFSLDLYGGR
jgi:hypothetical protein